MFNYSGIIMNASKYNDLGNLNSAGAYSKNNVFINCALNVPLMLISIIGNSLVLAAILKTPSLRSPSTVFLCSLAVSDLLVGFVVQPVYIADELKPGSSLSHADRVFSLSVCGVSLCTMTATSVDRFLALHYHMRYPNLMTEKRAVYTSATLWVINILLSSFGFWKENIYFSIMAAGTAICLLISTFSYIRIYLIVRRHQLQIHTQQQAVQSLNAEQNLNMVRSKKSAINTFIYYICMILCYSPALVLSLNEAILPKRSPWAWILASTVAYMNSSINPFLYCWRTYEIRMAVLNTLRTILLKPTGRN